MSLLVILGLWKAETMIIRNRTLQAGNTKETPPPLPQEKKRKKRKTQTYLHNLRRRIAKSQRNQRHLLYYGKPLFFLCLLCLAKRLLLIS